MTKAQLTRKEVPIVYAMVTIAKRLEGAMRKMNFHLDDDAFIASLLGEVPPAVRAKLSRPNPLKFIDLFSGIGGFHVAAEELGMRCVFASDIDESARRAYEANFGIKPAGDITKIDASDVPDHDLLFAGFPCQPFSIIGKRHGFDDPRGTLFFDVVRILAAKRPRGFVLENVKQMATADRGRVINRILEELRSIGYDADYRVLNALDFGLPQKRERTIIVGILQEEGGLGHYIWPAGNVPMKPLSDLLEENPSPKVFASERIRLKRKAAHSPAVTPSIWHENKSGNVSSHPYSCALRAGASYNYLLVNGERRLTARESLRLQGFPDSYKIVVPDSHVRKQTGNAVAVPVVRGVIKEVRDALKTGKAKRRETEAA